MLNSVQRAAYELIQADARFLCTLTVIQRNAKNINSNYIMMSQPYIGLFTDGAEQWCQKLGLGAPQFTDTEKTYYTALRQSHKLYEMSYSDYLSALMMKFKASDDHFYKIRSLREKLFGYYNVGLSGGEKILIPRAEKGNEKLTAFLAQAGAVVEDVPTYQTLYEKSQLIDEKKEFETGQISCAVFTSASTVKGFVEGTKGLDYSKVKAACIGRQTKAAAESFGMKAYMSEKATIDSLVKLVVDMKRSE